MQVRVMQELIPPPSYFMMQRSEHKLCLTWQRLMGFAVAGAAACKKSKVARPASAAA